MSQDREKTNLNTHDPKLPFLWPRTHAKSLQLCPTLCDPMDCSLPGSSVHDIFQARILEWVDISFLSPLPSTPHPHPGDLSDPGIKTASLISLPGKHLFWPTHTWITLLLEACKSKFKIDYIYKMLKEKADSRLAKTISCTRLLFCFTVRRNHWCVKYDSVLSK